MTPASRKSGLSKKLDRAARRPARKRAVLTGFARFRAILFRIFLAFVLLIIILAVAGFILYLNRNAAYETMIERALSERGYEAGLTVESVTTERAVIKNITLAQNGVQFTTVKSLTARYDWQELFEGKLQSLTLDEPQLLVEIDESGKITSEWLPAPSGNSAILPSSGIVVRNADIDVTSPYGDMQVQGDLKLISLSDLEADLTLKSAALSVREYSAAVEATLSAVKTGDAVRLSAGVIDLIGITGPAGPITSAAVKLDGLAKLPGETGILSWDGHADVTASQFTGPFFTSRRSALGFTGQAGFNVKTKTITPAKFDLNADLDGLVLADPKRRADLARRISIYKTLKSTPVAGVFIDDITGDIETLLSRADWNADLAVDYREDGYSVDLNSPLTVTEANRFVSLKPAGTGAEFAYDKAGRGLTLKSRIDLRAGRTLSLRDFSIRGVTDNGYLWTDIGRVSGRAVTGDTWHEGGIRLAPIDAAIDYRGGAKSNLKITTGLDYDGPLLGFDFTDLRAAGMLTLAQKTGGIDLSFQAQDKVTAGRVQTSFGYDVENASLTLINSGPVLSRRDGVDSIALTMEGLTGDVREREGTAHYAIQAGRAVVAGNRASGDDRYDVSFTDLNVTSDTVPGPDSRLKAADLTVALARKTAKAMTYVIKSPAVRARAGIVTLKDVGIDVTRTDDGTDFTYEGGTIALAGTNVPPLPVTGSGRLSGGRLTGSAKTALPTAPEFPIYADYVYENGKGRAELDIPKFIFSPNGVQPQDLAPVLRGKIAAVQGVAGAKATIGFEPGKPLTSKGTVTVTTMDVGTLVGPLTGLAATLDFDSLYPLRSSGQQTITMEGFDPGIPLGEGTVTFSVVKDGFDLVDARWPMGDGEISVKPTFWSTAGAVNKVTVDVRDIALGALIARFGNENLSATGQINGTLPVVIDGVNLTVEGGTLSIADGGVISVKTKGLDAAGEKNDVAKIAVDALKNFNYDELSLELNGPLDGEMKLGAVFTGSNPNVLGGADFLFRTNIEGELANIARNLASATQMQNIKKSIAQKVQDEKTLRAEPEP